MNNNTTKLSIAFSFIVIIFSLVYVALVDKYGGYEDDINSPSKISKTANDRFPEYPVPEGMKELNSTHEHLSFLLIIHGVAFNFFKTEFTERDPYAHLHPDESDAYIIHKHAIGLKLPYFLKTLGIELTGACLKFGDGKSYCNKQNFKLQMLVNGELVDLDQHEIVHGDRVLLNYGREDSLELKLRANNVPYVPQNLLE